jgi:hypothetical protein
MGGVQNSETGGEENKQIDVDKLDRATIVNTRRTERWNLRLTNKLFLRSAFKAGETML